MSPRLVGRKRELRLIDEHLSDLQRGPGAILAITGEPGIGKTRLLAEVCGRAGGRRHLVLEGRASEYERDVPFGLVVDALDDYLASLPTRRRTQLAGEWTDELGVVFPSLAPSGTGDRERVQAEPNRAHRAVAALLARLAVERPAVVALDDVHWADEASVQLLSYLVRHPPHRTSWRSRLGRGRRPSPCSPW